MTETFQRLTVYQGNIAGAEATLAPGVGGIYFEGQLGEIKACGAIIVMAWGRWGQNTECPNPWMSKKCYFRDLVKVP